MSKYLLLLKNLKTSQESTAKTALTTLFGSNGSACLRHISKNKHNEPNLAAPDVSNNSINLNTPETQWQRGFCLNCSGFNNWRGCCPLSIDECLLSRILDADSDVEKLKGFSIGQGITTDDVIQWWNNAGESLMDLIAQPLWFICIAEYLHVEKRL